MKEIAYTKRSLEFINSQFKIQAKPDGEDKYFIKNHIVSANFPIFEQINFKSVIYEAIVNGKNVPELRRALKPLIKISEDNIKLYENDIKPIWESVYRRHQDTYKGLKVDKRKAFGNLLISIETSKAIGYLMNGDDDTDFSPQKEYHNQTLYNYSLEINEFLNQSVYNQNWLQRHSDKLFDLLKEPIGKLIGKILAFIFGSFLVWCGFKFSREHGQASELHKDKTPTTVERK